ASAPVPTTRSVIGPCAAADDAEALEAEVEVDEVAALGVEVSVRGGGASPEDSFDDGFLAHAATMTKRARASRRMRRWYCKAGVPHVRSSQNGSAEVREQASHEGEATVSVW